MFVLSAVVIVLLYWYSLLSMNFIIILALVMTSTAVYCLGFLIDKTERKLSSFLLAPIAWFLFHLDIFVEIWALILAFWAFWRKRKVVWEKKQRKGVVDS